MRKITSLTTIFALALGLTGCGDDKNETTNTPTTNTTPDTTGASETASGTTGPGTSEPTSEPGTSEPTTAPATESASTVEPETTTAPATESATTTPATEGTTVEPGTTTDDGTSTGGGGGGEAPYQSCAADTDCDDGAICISAANTGGMVKGSFCSPKCSGPGKLCPDAAMGVMAQAPQCLFGADAMNPSNCAIICAVGKDECGPDSDCEDIGIEPQMGVTPGICTTPP